MNISNQIEQYLISIIYKLSLVNQMSIVITRKQQVAIESKFISRFMNL